MAKKSLKVNAVFNGIKTGLLVIFPLITFPYVSRVLQVENLGRVNFSSSIISYFYLIAALGISTYAIREGTGIKNNKKEFNKFANQIFTINIISTLISYIGLLMVVLLIPKLQNYRLLLFIQSISIIFTTLGIDWINSIYEDFFFVMIRSLIFQFVSVVLLFTMVHSTEDYYLYALITLISSVGANIFNFIHLRKYCKIRLTRRLNLKKHIKPIMVIFSVNIATIIYVNSDSTMIGFMVGDYSVGLYSVSVRIYTILKQLLVAVIVVALPRLSSYVSNNKMKEFNNTLSKILHSLILLMFPVVVGINILCNEIILFFSGKNYIQANTSLRILSLAFIFSTFASFMVSSILIPLKKEKYVLLATVISAGANVILNLFLIKALQQNGAAITTAIAEFLVLIISFYYARSHVKLKGIGKSLITSIIGCVAIVLVSLILKRLISSMIIYSVATVICSVITYFIVLLMLKNEFVLEFTDGFRKKIGSRQ